MVTPDSVKEGIGAGLACEHLQVMGDGQHFEAVIVSAAFEGKSRVQRHQLVYSALGDRMRLKRSRRPCSGRCLAVVATGLVRRGR